ncbi:GNAT family N-acetyltransferase [Microbacterium sp. NPDC077663]|uniref:GNAT family N-acetyltransferase n=1 Tax=Microbacterium sp. NPDC077663 TaxID=3364189 RepID=UPI0037C6A24A
MTSLGAGVQLREPVVTDAAALADAYRRNRERLAPWEPVRAESFFSETGQRAELEAVLRDRAAGVAAPFVLVARERVVGRVNLSGIVRGVFQSATLGYWIDQDFAGRGVMAAAVDAVVRIAADEWGLHRVQAGTLLHNAPSQAVLRRCGFTEIGVAPRYLKIAGRWQDHRLFQRILED